MKCSLREQKTQGKLNFPRSYVQNVLFQSVLSVYYFEERN